MNMKLVLGGVAIACILSAACNGDENDKWARNWVIQRHTEPVIVEPNKVGEFSLKAEKKGGKVVYYRVEFAPGKMTDNWKGVILFPRGLDKFPAWGGAKLPAPYDPAQADVYKDAIRDSLIPAPPFTQAPNTNTHRLEGDIEVKMANGKVKKEALTLYIVDDALTNNKELLIVQLRDSTGGAVQDGSGNGDPK